MKLTDVILPPGTRANQPDANAVPPGTLYYVTDENKLERSNGATWDEFAAPPGGGGGGSGVPDFTRRSVFAYYPSSTSSASVLAIGPALTEGGTRSPMLVGGSLVLNYLASSSVGVQAGFQSNSYALVYPAMNPDLTVIFRTPSDMTDLRLWVGFTSAQFPNGDTLTSDGACFRYSTVAGDAGWTPVTYDDTTQTVGTAIGPTPTADTIYRLRVWTVNGGATWKFSVDGGVEQNVSTNVPRLTEDMGWGCRVVNVTSSARNVGLVRVHLEFGEVIL